MKGEINKLTLKHDTYVHGNTMCKSMVWLQWNGTFKVDFNFMSI